LLTEEELAELARRGHDIQLHTHRHRTPRDETLFRKEIRENREVLEACTGRPAIHFCYPSGDVDDMFLPWLRETNVATATTGRAALATRDDDPLLLPRYVDTMAQSDLVFESWLCGIADLVKWPGR
jgi:peptidoglycan/xylan/chitin deacetylase (PgdA/CDA1 family)